MAFTDRFLKIPIKIFDRKEAELTNNPVYEDSWMKINPFEISDYKPTLDKDNENIECTYLSLKNGIGMFVYLTTGEFETLLNEHQK